MSEIFAGQLTAVANVVLAVFAIVTAVLAGLAFRKQSREVRDQAEMLRIQADQLAEDRKVNAEQIRVLGLQAVALEQAAADRERAAQDLRSDQATRVFVWGTVVENPMASAYLPRENIEVPLKSIAAYVKNTSSQPVYEVSVAWPSSWGPSYQPDHLSALMPGEEREFRCGLPTSPLSVAERAPREITFRFRHRAQVWWRCRTDGRLEETERPPWPA
jgi:hypothetical protein